MDFAAAWDSIGIGEVVAVSDGLPPPTSNTDSLHYKLWRHHNFTGTLMEKIDGDFRSMRFELPPTPTATIGYTVVEGIGHKFAPQE